MASALRKTVLIALVAIAQGCLEPMEPTATSSAVFIDPAGATGVELNGMRIVSAKFLIGNTGSRSIVLDTDYRRLEKLVNQEWRLVDETAPPFGRSTITVAPNASTNISYSVVNDARSASTNPLLTHVRGVYRVRFRLGFNRDGSDMLPAEESYSRPFGVSCC